MVLFLHGEPSLKVSQAQNYYNTLEPGLTQLSTSVFQEIINNYAAYNIIEIKHPKGIKGGRANRMNA